MGTFLIIFIAILCLCLLLYFCRPFLKKIKFPKIKFKKKDKAKINTIKIEKEEEKKVDPDVEIEQSNLDYDGFFKTDFSEKDDNYDLAETLNDNYDDMFEDLFIDVNPPKSKYTNLSSDISEIKDEELKDYFSEEYTSEDEKDISKVIQDLPPEVKAMIFANLLDKKEDN